MYGDCVCGGVWCGFLWWVECGENCVCGDEVWKVWDDGGEGVEGGVRCCVVCGVFGDVCGDVCECG